MAELAKIKLGGMEIPLLFSTFETLAIQEQIGCTGSQLKDFVFGIRKEEKDDDPDPEIHFDILDDPKRQKMFATLICILGNAGLEDEGQEAVLTEKFVMRNIKPGNLFFYVLAVLAVVNDAYRMESAKEQTGPVDETLEEENAKKPQGN